MTRRIKVDAEQAKGLLRDLHSMTAHKGDRDAHLKVHELIALLFDTPDMDRDHRVIAHPNIQLRVPDGEELAYRRAMQSHPSRQEDPDA